MLWRNAGAPRNRGFFAQQYVRLFHKTAPPSCVNIVKIRNVVYKTLQPIHFELKNDPDYGDYIYDEYFRGILVSPLFEGLSYRQMRDLVNKSLETIGLAGRVRFIMEPPSRFHKLKQAVQQRYPLEK